MYRQSVTWPEDITGNPTQGGVTRFVTPSTGRGTRERTRHGKSFSTLNGPVLNVRKIQSHL